jgi:hypothetical protein
MSRAHADRVLCASPAHADRVLCALPSRGQLVRTTGGADKDATDTAHATTFFSAVAARLDVEWLRRFRSRDLAALARAFARAAALPREASLAFFGRLSAAALARIGEATARDLVDLAWAFDEAAVPASQARAASKRRTTSRQ